MKTEELVLGDEQAVVTYDRNGNVLGLSVYSDILKCWCEVKLEHFEKHNKFEYDKLLQDISNELDAEQFHRIDMQIKQDKEDRQ